MKHRIWLIIPWAAFIVIVIGWIAYWNYVAGQAEARLQAWTQEQMHGGAHAAYSGIVRHGFPVLMRLEIRDFSYAPARGGWNARTESADLNIEMLNPAHIIFAAKAPIVITHGQSISTITADSLIVSIETHNNALFMAGIEGDAVAVDDPEKEGVFGIEKLVVNVRPDPRAAGDYQVAFDATNMHLPRPVRSFESLGLEVAQMRAAIVATHGAELTRSAPGDALKPWRDAGGVMRFEALALNWGALQATGSGEGGVDEAHRLRGHLALPIDHPAPLFQALASGPNVDHNAKQALTLLAAAYTLNNNGLTLDVDAENGVLRLEGLPVRNLPAAY